MVKEHSLSIILAAMIIMCASTFPAFSGNRHRPGYDFKPSHMTIYVPGLRDTVRLFVISDTHLPISDDREKPFAQYSKRMAAAYNHTSHFRTGTPTCPVEALTESLAEARRFRADAVIHLGDLVSFPSEYGIEWAKSQFDVCGLPWYYISGNHDWHYEGIGEDQGALRTEWSAKRLAPLYQGHNPLNYAVEVKGVKLILIDDSLNEIVPSQVKFLKAELKDRAPSVLLMHVPVATPGTSPSVFSIGSPGWGAAVDWAYKYESRPIWPEHHQQTDYDFLDTVLDYGASHNLLAVVCGHVHVETFSVQNGIATVTADTNSNGSYMKITLAPCE